MSAGLIAELGPALAGQNRGWSGRRYFAAALLASLFISLFGVFDHSLWTPDEPRDAEVGRWMLASGDYLVPTVAGDPFVEKPPLYWWAMTVLYRMFGVSDGVARLTSAVAGIASLLLIFDLANRLSNPFGGLMAALVTATMSGFYYNFHRVIVDPWLAVFVLLGYRGFVMAAYCNPPDESGRRAAPPAIHVLTIYLAAGMAFLVKGPIGPILIAVPCGTAALVGKRWDLMRSWAHVPGAVALAVFCAAWPYMLYKRGGGVFDEFATGNILNRIIAVKEGGYPTGHKRPIWYYANSVVEVLPWLAAIPALIQWLRRGKLPESWNRPAILFLASILPLTIVFLSIPETKRTLYLLPCLAPFGAVIGMWIASASSESEPGKLDTTTGVVLFALPGIAFVGATAALLAAYFAGGRILELAGSDAHYTPSAPAVVISHFAAGAVILPLTIWGFRLRRSRPAVILPIAAWMMLAAYALEGSVLFRMLDPMKNLHHMTAGLIRADAVSRPLIGFKLDETTMGAIPYDTGAVAKNTNDAAELQRLIEDNPGGHLLLIKRNLKYLPEDIVKRLRPVDNWRYSKSRIYCLFAFGKDEIPPPPSGTEETTGPDGRSQ
ncbi:MAG TPA: glycosyltransferase family 39 protein [Candidatus Brocadiia bacterium]|nr:glycosyltransferase family 39 protein [Candidatus Brocadiia bacterium]